MLSAPVTNAFESQLSPIICICLFSATLILPCPSPSNPLLYPFLRLVPSDISFLERNEKWMKQRDILRKQPLPPDVEQTHNPVINRVCVFLFSFLSLHFSSTFPFQVVSRPHTPYAEWEATTKGVSQHIARNRMVCTFLSFSLSTLSLGPSKGRTKNTHHTTSQDNTS